MSDSVDTPAKGPPAPQKRARRIAMSDEERGAFLSEQRTCRVGTVGVDGAPHVTAVWFVWDGGALWIYSIIKANAGPT